MSDFKLQDSVNLFSILPCVSLRLKILWDINYDG